MENVVFIRDINGFGRDERCGRREVKEGDWLVADPPWVFKPDSLRQAYWNLLRECATLDEFYERAKILRSRDFLRRGDTVRGIDFDGVAFIQWLKRRWLMIRAVRS